MKIKMSSNTLAVLAFTAALISIGLMVAYSWVKAKENQAVKSANKKALMIEIQLCTLNYLITKK